MSARLWEPLRPDARLEAGQADEAVSRRGAMSVLGLAGQGVLRLAVTVVIARLAGAHSLGEVAAGMALAQFVILLYPSTCGQAASRFIAEARGAGDTTRLRQVLTLLRARFLTAVLALSVLLVGIALLRGTPWPQALAIVVFFWGICGQQFTRGAHYGSGAVSRVVVLDIGCTLAGLGALVLCIRGGLRDGLLLLPLGVAYLLLAVACWPVSRREPVSAQVRRPIDHFVLLGSLGTLASAGLVQLSILQAAAVSSVVAGEYAAAWSLASPLTLLSAALSLVLYPTMAQAWGRGDRESVRRQLDAGFRGIYLVVPAAVALGCLLAPEIVGVAYGPAFRGAALPLCVLLYAVVATMLAVPCVNATTSQGTAGIAAIAVASLVGLLVAAVAWFALVPPLSGVGVALGYAIGVGVTAGYALWRAGRDHAHHWALLVVRLLVCGAALAGVLALTWDLSGWARGALGVGLAAGWVAALPAERRLVLGAIAPRRSHRPE